MISLMVVWCVLCLASCSPERGLFGEKLPNKPFEPPPANGGLNWLRIISCLGMGVAVWAAVANMGYKWIAIILGCLSVVAVTTMLQYYAKWFGLMALIGYGGAFVMLLVSMFIKKGKFVLSKVKNE